MTNKEARLDLLIFPARINVNPFGLDIDSIDRYFGVNWLGHSYAMNLLYPLLRKTSQFPDIPPPPIVFEASEMHRMAPSNVHFASFEETNNKSWMGPISMADPSWH
ncbi:hypothetical protein P152DRAFT_57301 [Eremomyces bilateralis CBS 781.70]|uniref:Uncharacterized protein n=1 Tax=Eremomyces bilateralis CBS 781.70 TaxID=1392243 RepID=A0A6G1G036_9PEZI|nr:uncharacterized protein P152DRAFT_57301 [Eremomyces bilateralis CBS 781.70]KAF1811475.1 hypothetical protein P152DRAFT_57301 [Eremomyces bilateralis CBS 781.70]